MTAVGRAPWSPDRLDCLPGQLPGITGMPGSGGSNRVLSLEETADIIGVAPSTLYKHWREWTTLRGYKQGNLVKFRERNVETYLAQLEQAQLAG